METGPNVRIRESLVTGFGSFEPSSEIKCWSGVKKCCKRIGNALKSCCKGIAKCCIFFYDFDAEDNLIPRPEDYLYYTAAGDPIKKAESPALDTKVSSVALTEIVIE